MGAARLGEPQGQPHRQPYPNKNTHPTRQYNVPVSLLAALCEPGERGGWTDGRLVWLEVTDRP